MSSLPQSISVANGHSVLTSETSQFVGYESCISLVLSLSHISQPLYLLHPHSIVSLSPVIVTLYMIQVILIWWFTQGRKRFPDINHSPHFLYRCIYYFMHKHPSRLICTCLYIINIIKNICKKIKLSKD